MTQPKSKKEMDSTERKEYKAQMRKGLESYYIFVQAQSTKALKYGYTKLVSREKGFEMIYGKLDPITQIKKKNLKYEYKQAHNFREDHQGDV